MHELPRQYLARRSTVNNCVIPQFGATVLKLGWPTQEKSEQLHHPSIWRYSANSGNPRMRNASTDWFGTLFFSEQCRYFFWVFPPPPPPHLGPPKSWGGGTTWTPWHHLRVPFLCSSGLFCGKSLKKGRDHLWWKPNQTVITRAQRGGTATYYSHLSIFESRRLSVRGCTNWNVEII